MEKEFVEYAEALTLRELGFDKPCLGYYVGKDKEVYISNETLSAPFKFRLESKTTFVAPLYQQTFKWFREKYKYSSYIKEATKDKYRFYIEKFDEKFYNSEILIYEKAELECLKKLIEIVKNDVELQTKNN